MKKFNNIYNEFLNDKQGILVDVRSWEEYNEFHLPNSINVSVDNIATYEFNKWNKIYLYCHSGNRSSIAEMILNAKGFNVINLGRLIDCDMRYISRK